ncbi:cupin domain-containing protein [Acidilobus sp.]|jgi:quercetin dioxygenase-like cupin family protein|uniref:cupin domain-containing protein n=1 Tax=Acidilobus sp. TaxID=1872109 RepID=UPI003D044CAA
MKFGNYADVPPQDVSALLPGTRGVTVQWLVSKADGSDKIALRRFVVKPHGVMPYHKHKYVEAVYIIKGTLKVTINGLTKMLKAGDFFYTGPYEPHSIENPSDEEAVFLCAISYEDDMSLQPVNA